MGGSHRALVRSSNSIQLMDLYSTVSLTVLMRAAVLLLLNRGRDFYPSMMRRITTTSTWNCYTGILQRPPMNPNQRPYPGTLETPSRGLCNFEFHVLVELLALWNVSMDIIFHFILCRTTLSAKLRRSTHFPLLCDFGYRML